MPHPLALLARLGLAFVLTYVLGFERELRGSPAGDRTFALIGVAGAVIGMIAVNGAQGILSGAATGVGFIGAALVFRPGISQSGVLHGVTTAAVGGTEPPPRSHGPSSGSRTISDRATSRFSRSCKPETALVSTLPVRSCWRPIATVH